VAVSAGGTQALALDAGTAFGAHVYLVLGSASGIEPGFDAQGLHIPLNADAWLLQLLLGANGGPFVSTFGILDAQGAASASLVVPAGAGAALAGLVLHHAAGVFDPATGELELVSNAVPLVLVP